ncbi:hypothetical protein Tco_0468841 [Tanacetum coccineum]
MIEDCCCWLVDEVVDEGASRLMVVDEGEPAISTAHGATATRTGEIALYGGLKYSSNIGYKDPYAEDRVSLGLYLQSWVDERISCCCLMYMLNTNDLS